MSIKIRGRGDPVGLKIPKLLTFFNFVSSLIESPFSATLFVARSLRTMILAHPFFVGAHLMTIRWVSLDGSHLSNHDLNLH